MCSFSFSRIKKQLWAEFSGLAVGFFSFLSVTWVPVCLFVNSLITKKSENINSFQTPTAKQQNKYYSFEVKYHVTLTAMKETYSLHF